MLESQSTLPARPPGVFAGALILGCGLLSIAVVMHHPVAPGHSAQETLQKIASISAMDQLVHGTLIALAFGLSYGFCIYALRRGFARQTSVAGLMLYLAGAAMLVIAAIIDGFFTPAYAATISGSTGERLIAGTAVLRAGAVAIQVCSKAGFLALSSAILIWSAGLLGLPGKVRYAAIAGAIGGIIPIAIILLWPSRLNPASLTLLLISQAVWNVTIGALMSRGQL